MIDETTFDSLVRDVAGVDEPDDKDLVQSTTVAVTEAEDDVDWRAKEQLNGLAIGNAALERLGLLEKALKKRVKDFRRALHLEKVKKEAKKTVIDHFGRR